jgi:phosphoribosylaminoimidazole-succinocarboxamide synthase
MRTLSKIIYQVTDQKNVGLAVFNDRATAFIQKQTNNLAVWAELVNQFENYIISTGKPR